MGFEEKVFNEQAIMFMSISVEFLHGKSWT